MCAHIELWQWAQILLNNVIVCTHFVFRDVSASHKDTYVLYLAKIFLIHLMRNRSTQCPKTTMLKKKSLFIFISLYVWKYFKKCFNYKVKILSCIAALHLLWVYHALWKWYYFTFVNARKHFFMYALTNVEWRLQEYCGLTSKDSLYQNYVHKEEIFTLLKSCT